MQRKMKNAEIKFKFKKIKNIIQKLNGPEKDKLQIFELIKKK